MKTLTYSEEVKGWPSFYSFEPERMIGMNNRFFSFKGGDLWIHNSDNSQRMNFYGCPYPAHIEGVINDSPHDTKTFKTFVLESTEPWDTEVESDLGRGWIDSSWYALKEGYYYSHIRRVGLDFDFRSAIGLSNVVGVQTVGPDYIVTLSFNIDTMVSVGDSFYFISGNTPKYSGKISNIAGEIVTVTIDPLSTLPIVGSLAVASKDSTAESYGTTGYYLKYKITTKSPKFVELFAIGSNLFKSYP